jgi:hypothetical protein
LKFDNYRLPLLLEELLLEEELLELEPPEVVEELLDELLLGAE